MKKGGDFFPRGKRLHPGTINEEQQKNAQGITSVNVQKA